MKLSELLRLECVHVGSLANDKALALCEIASMARKSPICRNVSEEDILEALQDRETLGATAFGNGIAIPHCRMKGVSDFVVGLMTVPNGVNFEAEDGEPVRLLVFIIAPHEQSDTHIRLLSALSQTLQDTDAVARMIAARSAKRLADIFLRAAGQDIQTPQPVKRNLVHIFVQDEKVFESILNAVSSLEGISLSILDAASVRKDLTRIPLYAGFSDAGNSSVCKVITAMVERRLSNEIIRRVEGVTGSLFECTGVMVTAQELAYCAGSLEM